MNLINSKIIITFLFFIFIIISGISLSRTGKPYSTLIITIHKLIGLGVGIYLTQFIYQLLKVNQLSSTEIFAVVLTILIFLGLVSTGGLISAEKNIPNPFSYVHKIFPYLAVASTSVTVYLLTFVR
jgi:hypothetical protein